jgi:hypothetical protein
VRCAEKGWKEKREVIAVSFANFGEDKKGTFSRSLAALGDTGAGRS